MKVDPSAPLPLVMYIVCKDTLSPGMLALACAHGSLGCYLTYNDLPAMQEWRQNSFRKKVVLANEGEWKNIVSIAEKEGLSHQIMTESRLDGAETCIAFVPRREWPKAFKFLRMA